jgi:branched-chain amino acid transport system substrate-binding protein
MSLVTRFARNADIHMIVGPIATSEALATGPVANENEVVMFTTATSPAVLEIGPWLFKSTETADAYLAPVAQHVAEVLPPGELLHRRHPGQRGLCAPGAGLLRAA